ncbi:MAG: DUF4232 domain-containing protein [Bowdeniella nasicola]|nr:DUF4232 domain-containing protein [Bowdeniella nasicola]
MNYRALAVLATAGCAPTPLPSPPPPSGVSPCVASDLSYAIHGEAPLQLRVTNAGIHTCTLKGYATVAFARDERAQPIGAWAEQQPGLIEQVTLGPGEESVIMLEIRDPDRYGTDCAPQHVGGLVVRPPQGEAWDFVEYPSLICTSASTPMLKVWPIGLTP